MKRWLALPLTLVAALAFASSAFAHAEISPDVALANHAQLFTLAVPTEKENAKTTKVELTPPQGFNIDSFVTAVGWKRNVTQTGSGENAAITKVTWTGGHVPTQEDAVFSFLASPSASKTYTFAVTQTYSDGSVVNWTGPESSDTPAPTIEAKDSLGGGGTSTLEIVALVVAVIALVVAIVAVVSGSGKRALA